MEVSMSMMKKLALSAAALALSAGMASAVTVTIHNVTGDGDRADVPNTAGSFAGAYGAFTPEGATWTTGVATFVGQTGGTVRSPWDQPGAAGPSPNNSYFAVGPAAVTQPQPAILSFGGDGVESIKMLWGSVDTYNKLTFGFSDGSTSTLGGAAFANQAGAPCLVAGTVGNRKCTVLATFSAGPNRTITSMTFDSTQQAFEFAFAPIPLPAPALLLLTGLGALGGLGAIRRRRQQAA
jgi:hypothetical protein